MILIGSAALKVVKPELVTRKLGDVDFLVLPGELCRIKHLFRHAQSILDEASPQGWEKTIISDGKYHAEYEVINPGSTAAQFAALVMEDLDTTFRGEVAIPSLDLLFTLKKSHRYLKNSPHFWKNAQDYHNMKAAGAIVRPEFKEFLKAREKETYNYKHPSLKQNKDSFFADDGIQYVWDHDTIHQAVAIYDKPAYTYYGVDGEDVLSSKEKFLEQPMQIRLAGVIEEASVLAIERSLVPHPGVKTPRQAWLFALMKVCTSITSGWFRSFAYEHIPYIVDLYPEGYWKRFNEAVKDGRVIPFTGSKYKENINV